MRARWGGGADLSLRGSRQRGVQKCTNYSNHLSPSDTEERNQVLSLKLVLPFSLFPSPSLPPSLLFSLSLADDVVGNG